MAKQVTLKTLEQLRLSAAQEECKYGERKAYALRLNETLPLAWFDISKSAPVADKVAVESERVAYIDILTAKKHGNPRQAWLKIREYARDAMAPAKVEAEGEEGEEGEAEGAATDKAGDQAAKWLKSLATIATQIEKAEAVNFPALKALDAVKNAIAIMSGGIKG